MNNPSDGARNWWSLASLSLALLAVGMSSTAINTALTQMANDLHATLSALQWVVNAYTLCIAPFVVLGGRLLDVHGRRRLFLVGLLFFALGSIVAATSS